MSQPPPPPPHGEAPKSSSGLPPGKYDIFVIPQHSAGSGFLYLPSLRPNVNSFAAGFASALISVAMFQSMAPAFQTWWSGFQGMGNMGMGMLMIAIGIGAWALGRMQTDKPSPRPEPSAGPGNMGGASGGFPGTPPGAGPAPGAGPPPSASQPPPQQPPPPPPRSEPPPNTGAPPPHGASNHGATNHGPAPNDDSSGPPPYPGTERPKSSWQQRPQPSTPRADAKGSWEKAREETRRREEERKAKEQEQKKKEETARKLREQREREAKERERREREARERREKLDAERRERMEAERREKELREKLEQERLEREELQRERERLQRERERLQMEKEERERVDRVEREKLEKLDRDRLERLEKERQRNEARERETREREAREKERERELAEMRKREEEDAKAARKAGVYAFSGVGERINPWPNGKPSPPAATPPPTPSKTAPSTYSASPKPAPSAAPSAAPFAAPSAAPSAAPPKPAPSTTFTSPPPNTNNARRPPAPSVNTFTGTDRDDDTTYSFRPYDTKPKPAPSRRKNSFSESSEASWAPSHTTARTSPPPSMRGPYTTKDPDKIVINGVYLFMNQFSKTPASQLISGLGSVTDGLILRITTEGLFIDDDVRGVPQREWDVKAWTLKQVEVWCPPHCLNPSPLTPGAANPNSPNVKHKMGAAPRVRDRGAPRTLAGDDADLYLTEMLQACKNCCRMGLCEATYKGTNIPSPTGLGGEWKQKGLHLLRATVRDQEGKRYLFVVGEEESWKVAVGLQRLRRGTQARALGVCAMTSTEARGSLEMLGWV